MRYLILFMSLMLSSYTTEKPNVILILADDLGYSGLNCYGGQFLEKNSNIDQLCKNGMKFTKGLWRHILPVNLRVQLY